MGSWLGAWTRVWNGGVGTWNRVWRGGVVLCMCEL